MLTRVGFILNIKGIYSTLCTIFLVYNTCGVFEVWLLWDIMHVYNLYCIILTNRQLHQCDTLHKILARGLGVSCNPKTGHIDLLEDMQYVMTLDYAVKMLTIHERRLCGIPVVIKGETGVGKTFLLETLSALWNHALLTMLEHERDGLKDNLKRDLNDYLLHSTAVPDKEQSKDVMEALESISGEKEISMSTITFIFEKKAFCRNDKFLYQKYLRMLLLHKTDPIFSILKLPDCVRQCYGTFSILFSIAERPRKDTKEVN